MIAVILTSIVVVLVLGIMISMTLYDKKGYKHIVSAVITLILIAGLTILCYWYIHNTQDGRRTIRNINNNFINNIEREVIVYDINGEVIQTFRGSFDIEYENDRIIFDSDDGRHIIYFKTGTIIVNDIESNEEEET